MIPTLLLLTLALSATGLPTIHGPVTNSLGAVPYRMIMSRDAKILVLPFQTVKNAEVFMNNGHGFEFSQSIPNTLGAFDLGMTDDGTFVYLHLFYHRTILIVKRIDGSYEFFQNISNPAYISSVQPSFDGEYLSVGDQSGAIRIFRLTGQYT